MMNKQEAINEENGALETKRLSLEMLKKCDYLYLELVLPFEESWKWKITKNSGKPWNLENKMYQLRITHVRNEENSVCV